MSGAVFGQALQFIGTAFGEDGVTVIKSLLRIDMYNASGWIDVLLNLINVVWLIFLFKVRM